MGMISDDDIERVRRASDLVEIAADRVVLQQRNREFWGRCPFHEERTPSFKIDPATQLWHCFGCSTGGDVFAYVMKLENMDFPDSVRYLARRAHIDIVETGTDVRRTRKTRLLEVCEETAAFYHAALTRGTGEGSAKARAYLERRGYGPDLWKRWDIGYAPGRSSLVKRLSGKGFSPQEMVDANVAVERSGSVRDRFYERVMFPIRDELGAVIAFGGRIIGEGEPKYLNSQETSLFHKSANLYALNKAKDAIVAQGAALVVEGYTDVISLHEAGIANVVATLGTALTEQHVKVLGRFTKRIVYVFDGDEAGQNAAERAIRYIGTAKADFYCIVLPEGEDPADYVEAHGKDAFLSLVSRAEPLVTFVIDRRLSSHDVGTPEGRARALADVVGVIAPFKGTLLGDDYAVYIADALAADVETVKRELARTEVRSPRIPGRSTPPEQPQHQEQPREDVPLSLGEKRAIRAERELLALIATEPDAMRPHAGTIAEFTWLDGRHETVAWSMLATPENTPARDVVAAAEAAQPGISPILSSGRLAGAEGYTLDEVITFLLDTLMHYTIERRIRQGTSRLRSPGGMDDAAYDSLFEEISALQKRATLLETRLRNVSMDL